MKLTKSTNELELSLWSTKDKDAIKFGSNPIIISKWCENLNEIIVNTKSTGVWGELGTGERGEENLPKKYLEIISARL